MTSVIAFCLIAGMLSVYTLLDGYDLGAGAISLLLAKTRAERSAILESIGPFWSGNEVWLVAAGGTLFALFPRAYAVSFSGFYLPFVVVLWLLMFRGIAIELREHLPGAVWSDFWDVAFAASSLLLVLLFGVALGNLVRGLTTGAGGYFVGTFASLLNPYAVAVGLLAVVALVQHGLAYIADNVAGSLGARALRFIGPSWWIVLALYAIVTVTTIAHHRGEVGAAPISALAGAVSLAGLVVLRLALAKGQTAAVFWASTAFLAGMLTAASATMYPYLIRPLPGTTGGLTIFDASPPPVALGISLVIGVAGLVVVVAYSIFVRVRMSEKATTTLGGGSSL